MKRINLLAALLLIMPTVKAQFVKSIGFKSGITISTQDFTYRDPTETVHNAYTQGIYAVATFEFFKSDYINLVTDLGIIQKGCKVDIISTTTDNPEAEMHDYFKSTIYYLSFSPLLKFSYPIKKFRPYVFAGPRIDVNLSKDDDLSVNSSTQDNQKGLFGLTYGGGLEYKHGKQAYTIEFQHQPDFTNFNDSGIFNYSKTHLTDPGYAVLNKAFVISAGLKFFLTGKSEKHKGKHTKGR